MFFRGFSSKKAVLDSKNGRTDPPTPPPRHSVQTNKMFVDVRRGGKKNFCSSMFVVVRRGLPLWQGPVRRCSSMFVDEHRRTKPTNILFVDEPKMFVCTLCLGGRIANVFYVIFIIFSPVGHFSGDPHAVPPQKWVSGRFWGVLRQKT